MTAASVYRSAAERDVVFHIWPVGVELRPGDYPLVYGWLYFPISV